VKKKAKTECFVNLNNYIDYIWKEINVINKIYLREKYWPDDLKQIWFFFTFQLCFPSTQIMIVYVDGSSLMGGLVWGVGRSAERTRVQIALESPGYILIDWFVLFSLTQEYSIIARVNARREKKWSQGLEGALTWATIFVQVIIYLYTYT